MVLPVEVKWDSFYHLILSTFNLIFQCCLPMIVATRQNRNTTLHIMMILKSLMHLKNVEENTDYLMITRQFQD